MDLIIPCMYFIYRPRFTHFVWYSSRPLIVTNIRLYLVISKFCYTQWMSNQSYVLPPPPAVSFTCQQSSAEYLYKRNERNFVKFGNFNDVDSKATSFRCVKQQFLSIRRNAIYIIDHHIFIGIFALLFAMQNIKMNYLQSFIPYPIPFFSFCISSEYIFCPIGRLTGENFWVLILSSQGGI
jgi:hypothetical protein